MSGHVPLLCIQEIVEGLNSGEIFLTLVQDWHRKDICGSFHFIVQEKTMTGPDEEPLKRQANILPTGKGSTARLGSLAALAVMAIVTYFISHRSPEPVQRQPAGEQTSPAPLTRTGDARSRQHGSKIGFATHEKYIEHYHKHGQEFGSITEEEYLRQAQELRDRPAGGNILEHVRADGVISRYDRASGGFLACNPDGVIRTYFRPNDGEAYFHRQAQRGPERQ
jgi:hypothetical protein